MIKLNRKVLIAIILSISVVATMAIAAGVTLARYANKHQSDTALTPKKFYFESTLLGLSENNLSYNNGTNSISFDLVNFADDERISEVDISYKVSVATSAAPETPVYQSNGTILIADRKATVSIPDLEWGTTYTVTVNATAPYTKTLTATFNIPAKENSFSSEIVDTGDIVYIKVTTGNYTGNVNLNWQNGYVPDNSYDPLREATGTSHTVTLAPNSSYSFRFFKSDLSQSFNEASFTVSENLS